MPKHDDQTQTRRAYLAGQWYPSDPWQCRTDITTYAAGIAPVPGYRGLIGPHAGWAYSGRTAVRGYATLAAEPEAQEIELCVVFGSHRSEDGPNTVFQGRAWNTPLGAIDNASELAVPLAALLGLEDEPVSPQRPDNAVELHLPFVRHFFPHAKLLMVGVAAAPIASEVGERTGELVRHSQRRAVFIGSTDLTHYGPNYGYAPHGSGQEAVAWVRDEHDRGFIAEVLKQDATGILAHAEAYRSACCPGAVVATLAALAAYGHGCKPRLVDQSQSCDFHPSSSFVGYASIVL